MKPLQLQNFSSSEEQSQSSDHSEELGCHAEHLSRKLVTNHGHDKIQEKLEVLSTAVQLFRAAVNYNTYCLSSTSFLTENLQIIQTADIYKTLWEFTFS